MKRVSHISDNSDLSYDELLQESESSDEDTEIGKTLSALSRLDTPITAYRRGFIEDLEAKVDAQLEAEQVSEDILDAIMDGTFEDYNEGL